MEAATPAAQAGLSPIGMGVTRPRSPGGEAHGQYRPKRQGEVPKEARPVPADEDVKEDEVKKVENDIEMLEEQMSKLNLQRGELLARVQDAEPAQGANLKQQVADWKAIMDKDRQEYEERRREQDRKLDVLMKLAELQGNKNNAEGDAGASSSQHPQPNADEFVLSTPETKEKPKEDQEDEWQSPGACPWSQGGKDPKSKPDNAEDAMSARMARIEKFMEFQETMWYASHETAEPEAREREGGEEQQEDADTVEPGIKALLEIVKQLKDEVKELKGQRHAEGPQRAQGQGGAWYASADGEEKSVPDMDRKLVTKPERYTGTDLSRFPVWQDELKAYLEMQDARFRLVLDKIEEYTTPIDDQAALNLALGLGIVQHKEAIDRNLAGYLKAFTGGEALKLVAKLGKEKIYEAYRLLCEGGRSRRPEHLAAMRSKVLTPRHGVPLTGLMSAILDWEKELEYVEKVYRSMGKTFTMDEEDRRLHIINMAPKDFADYLLRESARFCTYSSVRCEIVEHIARSKRPVSGLRSLAQDLLPEQYSGEAMKIDGMDELDDQEKEAILSFEEFGEEHQKNILALVMNSKFKSRKGKGKGKKGDARKGGDRDQAINDKNEGKGPANGCFKCGGSHYLRDCPQASEEEKAKGKGKGKKGLSKSPMTWPTMTQRKQSYPFPSKTHWDQWYPHAGKGGQATRPAIQAMGDGSWVDALKTSGNLIGCLRAQCKCDDHDLAAQLRDPRDILDWAFPNRLGVTGALAVPSDEPMPGETPQIDEDQYPPPAVSSTPRPLKAGRKMTRVKKWAPAIAFNEEIKTKNMFKALEVTEEQNEPEINEETMTNNQAPAMQMLRYLGEARAEAAIHAVSDETEDWEAVGVIMDSGAHVSVGPRELGRKAGYKVQESPGSRAGICYTAANGGELPNLGQRFMAVLTEEGTLKGMEQQVADVTKPLEAVRANLKAGHAIVFDDDGTGQGTGSFIINKQTGEINAIRDDGKDYVMRRWIVPPKLVPAIMQEQGFARQAS